MQPIEAADYHDIAKPESPAVSPDGDRVAFVRKGPDDEESYEATIHVVPTDGSESPRRFTLEEGVDAEPTWSPSGDRLAFTSTRGADDDRQQLWVVPTDGGEARQVTDVVGGVSAISFSPDGTRIAFVQSVSAADREEERDLEVPDDYESEDPDPRVIDRTVFRSAERYFDGARSHVYVVDLADDEIERITEGNYDFAAPEWGDDTTLYYTADWVGDDPDDTYEYDVVVRDTETGEDRQVHRAAGWGNGLAATADGRVAFPHTEPEQASIQPTELHVVDAEAAVDAAEVDAEAAASAAEVDAEAAREFDGEDGEVYAETVDVTADLDRTLGYEASPQWGPDEELLYFTTPDEGKTALWHAPGDGSTAPERVLREGAVSGGDVAGDEGDGPADVTVAVAMSQWDHPGDVFVSEGDGAASGAEEREVRRLTELNGDYLHDAIVGEPEELRFESERGEVHGWVLTPPGFEGGSGDGDGAGEYPLVVEIHGGPHAMWTTSGTMWHEFQTLAARGYVVFWSNPRGSSGYGEEYMQAIERDWGDVTLTDVMAGVEEVAAREYVDEDNVFVTGGSFGGYMTAWTVGQTDYFDAAVSQRGVYDLTSFYGSTDGAYKLVEGDFDTTPWEEPEFLWEQSPTGHSHEVDTPTLVLHSEDDFRTPICTAELFHRMLRKRGVETRFVRYPREGHELSRSGEPGHVVDRIERIARWFDGYSDHHDAPKALDRPDDDGLTAGESAGDRDDETDGGSGEVDGEE